jgi:O-antigen/teichoic acid export membrane protein
MRLSFLSKIILKNQLKNLYLEKFFRQVVEMYVAKISIVIFGLIYSVVVSRLLGPEGRGVLVLAVTITALGSQIGNLGLQASITNKIAQNKKLLLPFLGNALFVSFVFCGITVCIYWTLVHIAPRLAPVHGKTLILALMGVPLSVMYLYLSNILLALDLIRPLNLIEVTNRILGVLIVSILLFLGVANVDFILVFSVISSILFLLVATYCIKEHLINWPKPSFQFFRKHFCYGFRIYVATLLMYLVLKIDTFMVNAYMGEEAVGYYSLAVGLIDMIYMLPVVVGTILFPKLSAMKSSSERWGFTLKILKCTAVIMFLGCILIGMIAQFLIEGLYGSIFLPSVTPFICLLPAIYALSLNTILMNYLASQGAPNITFISPAIAVITNVLLNWILIPQYGLIGASIASIISYMFMLTIALCYCHTTRSEGIGHGNYSV